MNMTDMADSAQAGGIIAEAPDYDAVIVGASLAGSTTAIMLGRAGLRVALVEQRPDPDSFKRVCSHYIQASAVATLERVGLLAPIEAAGGVRSRGRLWTRWGWIAPSSNNPVPPGVNLRREKLDPLVRRIAAETAGVELLLGRTASELVRDGSTVRGVRVRDASGETLTLRARLVVGADGRDSRTAKLAGVKTKTVRHGRFAYGGYFEGPLPAGAPDASLWMLDPHMAACFPTDSGQTFYAAMPTKERLPEFRADPAKALVDFIAAIPEAPPIRASRLIEPVQGKLDMTNVAHALTAPGLAFVGDAALAIDPLWGVGCGWAFQSAEWLSNSVAPALLGAEPMDQGLTRYRRRYNRGLRGHAFMIYDYAGGRKFSPGERLLFSAAARDEHIARTFEAFGTRSIGPARFFATTLPRAAFVNARHALSGGSSEGSRALGAESA
ncbi:MAG TPA: NAD(P)/FAD-dependent oxidoreductase [Solirubrobacteraceae bacterium]|jgi:2-polyprenyl-6-methoxyphenol hydroxylase-like FAD-dependent oxidoreductase|nr:NAD(P)/FAD-dependent oxidoreductase [Solirubrobacteraceae bacterium]